MLGLKRSYRELTGFQPPELMDKCWSAARLLSLDSFQLPLTPFNCVS